MVRTGPGPCGADEIGDSTRAAGAFAPALNTQDRAAGAADELVGAGAEAAKYALHFASADDEEIGVVFFMGGEDGVGDGGGVEDFERRGGLCLGGEFDVAGVRLLLFDGYVEGREAAGEAFSECGHGVDDVKSGVGTGGEDFGGVENVDGEEAEVDGAED